MVAFKNPIIYSLIIPSGATSGTRVVIDGVNGVIDIYNSSNQLTGQIGNGVISIEGFVNGSSYSSSITLSVINNDPILGFAAATQTFSTGVPSEASPASIYAVYDVPLDIIVNYWLGPESTETPTGRYVVSMTAAGDHNAVPAGFTIEYIGAGGATTVVASSSGGSGLKAPANNVFISDGQWNALGLVNGWTAFGGVYSTPGYRLLPDGTVVCRGAVSGGIITTGTTVFTVGAGYAPISGTYLLIAVGGSNGTFTGLTVDTAGNVKCDGVTSAFLGLDTVRWMII